MKPFAFVVAAMLLLLALASPAALRAQIPPPATPSPDPHLYSDPGMNYMAPAEAVLVGRRYPKPADLGSDLETVAVWALHPGKEDMRTIQISMESFTGAPDQWEGQFESQMHSAGGDGLLIRNRTPMSLLNGMPATFVELTSGSGFTSAKQFAVVWADGQRGIVLAESSRLGDANADEAKNVLRNATAVRYPVDEP
ncbi:MAG: hypothetical protein JOY69_03925 [Candidatus Eremiobacteraeota bacterium]|nr:hypothetical protein [Candidatus Eremiobacteraeota bacterium]